jgi:hypothetical protein
MKNLMHQSMEHESEILQAKPSNDILNKPSKEL